MLSSPSSRFNLLGPMSVRFVKPPVLLSSNTLFYDSLEIIHGTTANVITLFFHHAKLQLLFTFVTPIMIISPVLYLQAV